MTEIHRMSRNGRFKDMTGQRFGRLVVLSYAGNHFHTQKKATWHCVCDCGEPVLTAGVNLRSGHVKSCGCLQIQAVTSHGKSKNPLFKQWVAMIHRCHSPKSQAYKRYGGRGIFVCEDWRLSFEAFARDVGPRPSSSHTLDRIDNDRGYEPGNVRWATWSVQQNNRGNNTLVECEGESMTISEWSRKNGIKTSTICQRIKQGWEPKDAVKVPARKGNYRKRSTSSQDK